MACFLYNQLDSKHRNRTPVLIFAVSKTDANKSIKRLKLQPFYENLTYNSVIDPYSYEHYGLSIVTEAQELLNREKLKALLEG